MLKNNLFFYSGKILAELGRDILYFPVWWYAHGLLELIDKLIIFIKNREKGLALSVWVKNIFRPMYGQTDWQGKLISFGFRIFEIIARGIIMLFWLIFVLIIIFVWIILPIFVVYEIIFQIHG